MRARVLAHRQGVVACGATGVVTLEQRLAVMRVFQLRRNASFQPMAEINGAAGLNQTQKLCRCRRCFVHLIRPAR
jgi:hypothetical protein